MRSYTHKHIIVYFEFTLYIYQTYLFTGIRFCRLLAAVLLALGSGVGGGGAVLT